MNWMILILTPLFRNLIGWLENSLKDNKIQAYEWRQLIATMLRVGTLSLAAYLGLDALGQEQAELIAGSGVFIFDFILSKLKK